jgi:hypothetical protein
MPRLNQTSTSSESDLRTSVRMVLGAIPLKPVNPAFKRLTELACRRDLQPRPATVDLRIQFDEAQLGQTFLMINDAATLAHALRANGMPASDQPLWVHDLTHDTPRNRVVLAALEAMRDTVRNRDLAAQCGYLARDLHHAGVSQGRPSRGNVA